MNQHAFRARFAELTGHEPLSWQWRLFEEWTTTGTIPPVIDLPTGLGKTMVMAIWLIARTSHFDKVPTRLVYVVDRRTVVDQATELAQKLRCNSGQDKLAISTLRGQLADNREWSADPSRPAIIIGTVDLIGSALLFSGYRSSYKRRPLEAGLLGQDSLLVLDEAHLSKPFEKLVTSISALQGSHGRPMRVVRMSATTDGAGQERFALEESDLSDKTIEQRLTAKKRLTIETTDNVTHSIATAAGRIASGNPGSRIVIFVKSPKDVSAVRAALVKMHNSRESRIAVLTGTMRGLERDELVAPPTADDQHARRVMQRFLNPANDPSLGECFLVSTSAGEVGFDLNADHLVGDPAPLDAWIQRLGRVNRRGSGDATVVLVSHNAPADETPFEWACVAASQLLTRVVDVSPKGLAAFKRGLTQEQVDQASSPKPTTVELTDILLDTWSMTSIIEPIPGRPAVAPWLRGIADHLPSTTIAWRAELDLPGFDALDVDTIAEWFDTHRVLTHETLAVPTGDAAKWFADRWKALPDGLKAGLRSKRVIIDRAGLTPLKVETLIEQLSRKGGEAAIRNAHLILPASFGGIERGKGLLEASAPEVPQNEKDRSLDEQRVAQADRAVAADVADIAPGRPRLRVLETTLDGGQQDLSSIGGGEGRAKSVALRIQLESDDDRTVRLISYVPRREKPELGSGEPETLKAHVGKVRNAVDRILNGLSVPEDITRAAQLAADFHDHGKARDRWQRLLVFPRHYVKPNETMGKSGGEMKRDPRGYRHEFGSMREFIDAHAGALDDNVFDLAMHLIAAHHGRGRPHFAKGGFDPECEDRTDQIHIGSVRRFARLQRKYGWWYLAWLENLLRCADALASNSAGGAVDRDELEAGQ